MLLSIGEINILQDSAWINYLKKSLEGRMSYAMVQRGKGASTRVLKRCAYHGLHS